MSMERCIATLIALSFILLSPTAETAFSADKADKLTQVRMGLAARSTTSMPFFVAKERGFFREEGLDVELIVMQAIQTIQATMGKSLQFASATGSAVSAAVNGADIKVILAVTDRPSFDLIAQPNITSIQQLRGKKIGTGGVGSLAEILSRRILTANNVRPEEVTILATGPSHVTYMSLKAKVIDAAPLQMPLTFTAQDEGFRKLAAAGRRLSIRAGRSRDDQSRPNGTARNGDQSSPRHAACDSAYQKRQKVRHRIHQRTVARSRQRARTRSPRASMTSRRRIFWKTA